MIKFGPHLKLPMPRNLLQNLIINLIKLLVIKAVQFLVVNAKELQLLVQLLKIQLFL